MTTDQLREHLREVGDRLRLLRAQYPACNWIICRRPAPEHPQKPQTSDPPLPVPPAIRSLKEFEVLRNSDARWVAQSVDLRAHPLEVWCSDTAGWRAMLDVGGRLMATLRTLTPEERVPLGENPAWQAANNILASLGDPPNEKAPPELRNRWLEAPWIQLVVDVLLTGDAPQVTLRAWTLGDSGSQRITSPADARWWSEPAPVAGTFAAVVDALLKPLAPSSAADPEWSGIMTLKEIAKLFGGEPLKRSLRLRLERLGSELKQLSHQQWQVRLTGLETAARAKLTTYLETRGKARAKAMDLNDKVIRQKRTERSTKASGKTPQ